MSLSSNSLPNLPLVSIVMPSYNQALYLEKAIQSVLNQDYPNIEFFVVDGGSSDESVEIIRKYHKTHPDRLVWWVSEKDKGQADAINKGFKRTKGEIFAWLNSDDIYLDGAVNKAVKIFRNDPDLGFVYSNIKSIDKDGHVFNEITYDDWGVEDLMAFCILGQAGVFMRRDAFESVGGLDSSYDLLLDALLFMRIANRYKIRYINDFFAAARIHPEAKNISQAKKFGDEAFKIVEMMPNDADFMDIYWKNRRRIHAGAYRLGAHYLLDGGDYVKSFNWYMKSLWHHPPTALKEFSRLVFALFSIFLPLDSIKREYLNRRAAKFAGEKYC